MTPTSEVTQKTGLDKFYTIPSISEKCISIVGRLYNWSEWDFVIEPSAGNGSFLTQLPTQNRIGIDIAPEHDAILEQDFFTYRPPLTKKKVLVIGNPPFGRVSSLAIRFFNHAAEWASVIAFILPRTFRRISVQKKLNRYFHIEYDEDIPTTPCSFHPPMMAKCCFQIWSKKETMRPLIELPVSHTDWEFLALGPKDANGQPTPPQGADFAIRAYGGKCGEIVKEGLESLRPKSWHWIRSTIDTETLLKRFESLDYSLSLDTARQNSIGKGELVMLYSDSYD